MKIRKTMICLALCLTLIAGGSMTALASSGNINYGGSKATWSMSTSKAATTLTNSSSAALKIEVKLYYKSLSTGKTSSISKSQPKTGSSVSYSKAAPVNCFYISNSLNKFTYFVNGNTFASCSPQP